MRFSDTLLRKKRRQYESNRPLWDWSTDLLVMSRNQVGKRATCSFILFIENSSHIYYAVWRANFNFLAQLIIITILFSLRFSRQNKHNTICNIIPFASLRTQKRWLNIRWFLGPQQWFYIKNSNRTTQSGVSPFPISLSLIASHFLSDTDTMLALFVNGLMWSFSMIETFSDSGGIFRSMAVLENIPILWNWQSQFFSRLLEDKVRDLLSDRGCWVGMSQNTCVLIVGTRFCHQRSHFYSYRYRCPEMKFGLTQLSGGSAST